MSRPYPCVAALTREQHAEEYMAHRIRYLPRQLAATERKLAMLRNEARRLGMFDLLAPENQA